jgi:hypothetical protein
MACGVTDDRHDLGRARTILETGSDHGSDVGDSGDQPRVAQPRPGPIRQAAIVFVGVLVAARLGRSSRSFRVQPTWDAAASAARNPNRRSAPYEPAVSADPAKTGCGYSGGCCREHGTAVCILMR